uniref:NEP1-interacting protein-like 1 n=1 Tax=Rhizophora mucronata TaxID=61149 RepID=A0A2P2IMV3_RHIMU
MWSHSGNLQATSLIWKSWRQIEQRFPFHAVSTLFLSVSLIFAIFFLDPFPNFLLPNPGVGTSL